MEKGGHLKVWRGLSWVAVFLRRDLDGISLWRYVASGLAFFTESVGLDVGLSSSLFFWQDRFCDGCSLRVFPHHFLPMLC